MRVGERRLGAGAMVLLVALSTLSLAASGPRAQLRSEQRLAPLETDRSLERAQGGGDWPPVLVLAAVVLGAFVIAAIFVVFRRARAVADDSRPRR